MPIVLVLLTGLLVVDLLDPPPLPAQVPGADVAAYHRLVSDHFSVAPGEVAILSEGVPHPDELPVLLRLSRASGISPAALSARRRSGESWLGIARRYGLGAGAFHITIPEDQVGSQVERAHRLFSETPSAGWDALDLRDEELVALSNLDFLHRELGTPMGRILESHDEAGSFVGALRGLVASR